MTRDDASDQPESLAALVESVTALAEYVRLRGPAPDCSTRMDELIARHRARIDAARQEAVEGAAPNAAD